MSRPAISYDQLIHALETNEPIRIDVPGTLDDACEPFATVHTYVRITTVDVTDPEASLTDQPL